MDHPNGYLVSESLFELSVHLNATNSFQLISTPKNHEQVLSGILLPDDGFSPLNLIAYIIAGYGFRVFFRISTATSKIVL